MDDKKESLDKIDELLESTSNRFRIKFSEIETVDVPDVEDSASPQSPKNADKKSHSSKKKTSAKPAEDKPAVKAEEAPADADKFIITPPDFDDDTPEAEPVSDETPAADTVIAEPVFEEPVTDTVIAEPVFEEEPATDTVIAEPVFEDAPATDTVIAEPVFEEPATDTVIAEPVFEEPVTDVPAESVVEAPAVKEEPAEEPAPAVAAPTGGMCIIDETSTSVTFEEGPELTASEISSGAPKAKKPKPTGKIKFNVPQIIIMAVLGLVALWCVVFTVDHTLAANGISPVFSVKTNEYEDQSLSYKGLGYKVQFKFDENKNLTQSCVPFWKDGPNDIDHAGE